MELQGFLLDTGVEMQVQGGSALQLGSWARFMFVACTRERAAEETVRRSHAPTNRTSPAPPRPRRALACLQPGRGALGAQQPPAARGTHGPGVWSGFKCGLGGCVSWLRGPSASSSGTSHTQCFACCAAPSSVVIEAQMKSRPASCRPFCQQALQRREELTPWMICNMLWGSSRVV